ncbi:MAG: hypothetical protein QXT88_01585 [Desulfurococcaceae archaeon]|uniref:Uncharacterized protein n=1 Tax=Staphylothermus marinus TaxID=2280 RepID=A0A7C4H9U6_STAMA
MVSDKSRANYNEIVKLMEEAIDLIDKIEMIISRIDRDKPVSSGVVYQIYENLVLLREKIVEARMKAIEIS